MTADLFWPSANDQGRMANDAFWPFIFLIFAIIISNDSSVKEIVKVSIAA
jgi:hypothetical protein